MKGWAFSPPFFSGPRLSRTENLTKPPHPFGEETARLLAEALKEHGLELCHVDWRPGTRRGVLTLYIDREEGVTLDDCARASHAVDGLLESAVETAYVLEVSSPGLDRPLWTLADCLRFRGRRVMVRLLRKIDGTSNLKGILEGVDGDALTVLDEDRRRGYTVRFGDVKLARLIPEF